MPNSIHESGETTERSRVVIVKELDISIIGVEGQAIFGKQLLHYTELFVQIVQVHMAETSLQFLRILKLLLMQNDKSYITLLNCHGQIRSEILVANCNQTR